MLSTITRVNPQVACFQECMVNKSGMDETIAASLSSHNGTPYSYHSDPSIVTNIKEYGVQGTEFPPAVATIFAGLIHAICMLLQIPGVGALIGMMPLLLER